MPKIVIRDIDEKYNTTLKETYKGLLYHYTTLPLLYSILTEDALISDHLDDISIDRRGTHNKLTNNKYDALCFTRDKNYNIRRCYNLGVQCRLVFDADKLMTIRHARMYPVNFSQQPKINKPNEAEERLYGVNVAPLSKYVERIDIYINDLSNFGDGNTDLEDRLYDKYYDSFFDKYPNATDDQYYAFIGKILINKITNMPKFKNKINISNSAINEHCIDRVIKKVLNEYLDKDYMQPLRGNLNMSEYEKVYNNVLNNLDMAYDYLGLENAYDRIYNKLNTGDENTDMQNAKKYTSKLMKKYYDKLKYWSFNSTSGLYAPTFNSNVIFKDEKLFKNGWVIHFTNYPYSIINNGFNGFTKDVTDNLWRTYGRAYKHETKEGYCFAYDVNDDINVDYGSYGLIFRTSGIKVTNRIDGDEQVIFNAANANLRDCIIMHIQENFDDKQSGCPYDDNYRVSYNYVYEIINPYNNKVIYKNTDFHKTVNWAINNFSQYKGLKTNAHGVRKVKNKILDKWRGYANLVKSFFSQYIDATRDKTKVMQDNIEVPNDSYIVLVGKKDKEMGVYPSNLMRRLKEFGLKETHPYSHVFVDEKGYIEISINTSYRFDSFSKDEWVAKYGELPKETDDIFSGYMSVTITNKYLE